MYSTALRKLVPPLDSYNYHYKDRWVEMVRDLLKSVSSDIVFGSNVLELGAGVHNPLACAISALARGARSTLSIEPGHLDPDYLSHAAEHALLASVMSPNGPLVRPVARGLLDQLQGLEAPSLDDLGLALRSDISAARSLGAEYHVVHSKAVIEHVMDLDAVLDAINAVCAPTAYHVHEVDFIDHDFYTKKMPENIDRFSFLFEGAKPLNATCNRLRYSQVIEIFERNSLRLISTNNVCRAPFLPEYVPLLEERFAGLPLDVLAVTSAQLIFERVAR